MSDYLSEKVLCFPSLRLDAFDRPQGFVPNLDIVRQMFINCDDDFSFRPRSEVEEDPSFKQVITYSIIQYGHDRSDQLFFSYTRGQSGGEDRLKAKRSLGIGGHVSDSVKDQAKFFVTQHHSKILGWCRTEAQREIDEEVIHNCRRPLLRLIGLINDDSNSVGRVHVGLVYAFIVNTPDIFPHDGAIKDGDMLTVQQITNQIDSYENWSKLIIKSLAEETFNVC
jgi:predicted NUDIX family phosphoesterase